MRKITTSLVLLSAPFLLNSCAGCQNQTNQFINDAVNNFYGQVVKVPLSSSTMPVATLKIPSLGYGRPAQTLTSGGKSITIPLEMGSSFFVTATADDPDGVKEVDLLGGGTINCSNEQGLGANVFVDGLQVTDVSPAQPGQNATTRRSVIYLLNLQEWLGCPGGFSVKKVTISLYALAKSFGGPTATSPSAVFTYAPGTFFPASH